MDNTSHSENSSRVQEAVLLIEKKLEKFQANRLQSNERKRTDSVDSAMQRKTGYTFSDSPREKRGVPFPREEKKYEYPHKPIILEESVIFKKKEKENKELNSETKEKKAVNVKRRSHSIHTDKIGVEFEDMWQEALSHIEAVQNFLDCHDSKDNQSNVVEVLELISEGNEEKEETGTSTRTSSKFSKEINTLLLELDQEDKKPSKTKTPLEIQQKKDKSQYHPGHSEPRIRRNSKEGLYKQPREVNPKKKAETISLAREKKVSSPTFDPFDERRKIGHQRNRGESSVDSPRRKKHSHKNKELQISEPKVPVEESKEILKNSPIQSPTQGSPLSRTSSSPASSFYSPLARSSPTSPQIPSPPPPFSPYNVSNNNSNVTSPQHLSSPNATASPTFSIDMNKIKRSYLTFRKKTNTTSDGELPEKTTQIPYKRPTSPLRVEMMSEEKESGLKPSKQMQKFVKGLEKLLPLRNPENDVRKNKQTEFERLTLGLAKVKLLTSYLMDYGMTVEGLFRVSVGTSELEEFWDYFISGTTDFSFITDPNIVAAGLKMYIREQDQPLIPFNQYDLFLSCLRLETLEQQKKELSDSLKQLPEMNRNIIYVLLALFRKITLNSNTTFMTAENLGIVWGPNFLRPKEDTSQTMMDMTLITKMVPILINSTDEIPLDESIHQLTEEEKKELKETAKVYVLPANDTKEKPHFENKQEDTHAFKQNSIYTMFESLLSKKKIILRGEVLSQFFRIQQVFFKAKRTIYKPQYMVLSNKNIHTFNIADFTYDFTFSLAEVKEILLDKEDLGLCSVYRFYVKNPLYYHAGNKSTLENIIKFIEDARSETNTMSIPHLITRSVIIKDVKEEGGIFIPRIKDCPAIDALYQVGFSEEDIWDGTADLYSIVKKFKLQNQGESKTHIVQFVLPDLPEFTGTAAKAQNVDRFAPISSIIQQVCHKLVKDTTNFSIATLKGKPLAEEECLAAYGLGSIFEGTWQLRLVPKESVLIGNFVVDFTFPDLTEFSGLSKKSVRVDVQVPIASVIEKLCQKLGINNPQRFVLVSFLDPIPLDNNRTLSSYGLGVQFKNMQLKLILNPNNQSVSEEKPNQTEK